MTWTDIFKFFTFSIIIVFLWVLIGTLVAIATSIGTFFVVLAIASMLF